MGCSYSKDIHTIEEYGYVGQIKFIDNEIVMCGQGKQTNEDGSTYVGFLTTTNIMDTVS